LSPTLRKRADAQSKPDSLRGQDVFRFDPNVLPAKQRAEFAKLHADPRFAKYGDDSLEMMLMHHSADEVLQLGPEEALDRYNGLSVLDGLELGGIDFMDKDGPDFDHEFDKSIRST
jgi:hypothetical protein